MGGGGSKSSPQKAGNPSSSSSSGSPQLSQYEQAQLQLKIQRDRCSKAQRRLDHEAGVCLQRALAAKEKGDKTAAIRFLKLKALKEKHRDDVSAQLYNMESLVVKLEEAKMNNDVLAAMEKGSKAIKAIQEELPLEKAEQIMEDTQDAMEYGAQLDAIFSREIAMGGDMQKELEDAWASLGLADEGEKALGLARGSSAAAAGRERARAAASATATAQEAAAAGEESSSSFAFNLPAVPSAAVGAGGAVAARGGEEAGAVAAGGGGGGAVAGGTRTRAGSGGTRRVAVAS